MSDNNGARIINLNFLIIMVSLERTCSRFFVPHTACIHTLTYDITSLHSWLKPVSFLFSNLRLKPEVNSMLRKFKVAVAVRTLVCIGCKRTEVHATLKKSPKA